MSSVRLRDVTIYELEIPFAEPFAHSTKERYASDAVIVRVQADDGAVGYGEGLGRPYVTGETVESIHRRVALSDRRHHSPPAEPEPAHPGSCPSSQLRQTAI